MRTDLLTSALAELNDSFDDIEGLAVSTTDGLMLASHCVSCVDARIATLLAMSVQLAKHTAIDKVEHLLVQSKEGFIMLSHIGSDAVLAVLAKPHAPFERISAKARHVADAVAHIISAYKHRI